MLNLFKQRKNTREKLTSLEKALTESRTTIDTLERYFEQSAILQSIENVSEREVRFVFRRGEKMFTFSAMRTMDINTLQLKRDLLG